MRVGIVGKGVVGRHMATDICGAGHEVVIYDPAFKEYSNTKNAINTCDAAFIAVSTPMAVDGSADLSAIRGVFGWMTVPLAIVRSTVPPGTIDELARNYSGQIVFVPEFIGEGVNAPYNTMKQPPFLIIGGTPVAREKAIQVLSHIYNAECEFVCVDAKAAEVAKYAENFALALKVGWANDLYDICDKVGADFGQMMNAVTHDYRISRSHTHIYADKRGWSGRCIPKDLNALLAVVGADTAPLLASAIASNEIHRGKSVGNSLAQARIFSQPAGGNL